MNSKFPALQQQRWTQAWKHSENKNLAEKLTLSAPNFPEERYTQQVKLTIELGSEDVNQISINTSGTSHLSTCGEDDADGRIPPDGLHTPVVCIIQDVQNKDEFNTLITYKGTLIDWQSTNNLQHKEEFYSNAMSIRISTITTFKIFAFTYELEANNTLRLSFTRTKSRKELNHMVTELLHFPHRLNPNRQTRAKD